jgi:hypothetical protein
VAVAALVMAGACPTRRKKVWVALLPTLLEAVNVSWYTPPVPVAGVPLRVAVLLPLSLKVTPLGNAPLSVSVTNGMPVPVTVKLPLCPTPKTAVPALVMVGAAPSIRRKLWVALLPEVLWAVMVKRTSPASLLAGVPLRVAVPLPLSLKVTPLGKKPDSVRLGAGNPVVVTRKEFEAVTAKVVSAALVICGATLTSRVKLWVALGLAPLCAVIVTGKTPPLAGVPLRVAVPLPLSVKKTLDGKVPVKLRAAVGLPVLVTVKVPLWPTVKVVDAALVMVGACATVSVKVWVAAVPTPFWAVRVRV